MSNPGNAALIASVTTHVERHVGPVDLVWDELDSDALHVDVLHVAAGPTRPYQTLVTCGASEFPMSTPAEYAVWRFAELCILLPPDWPITTEGLRDPATGWPFWLLKQIARYPHEAGTWLGYGHTVS